MIPLSVLIGKTIKSIGVVETDNEITGLNLQTQCDEKYQITHHTDCCEHVYLEDVGGDLVDLIGSPLIEAESISNEEERYSKTLALLDSSFAAKEAGLDSFTWTFYKLGTIKGSVTLRWLGESNGYYSEDMDFEKVTYFADTATRYIN